jgi:hypothetical protein
MMRLVKCTCDYCRLHQMLTQRSHYAPLMMYCLHRSLSQEQWTVSTCVDHLQDCGSLTGVSVRTQLARHTHTSSLAQVATLSTVGECCIYTTSQSLKSKSFSEEIITSATQTRSKSTSMHSVAQLIVLSHCMHPPLIIDRARWRMQ